MKAITVQQPWAWAIIHGGKNIENRARAGAWRPAVGLRIAIHAGRQLSAAGAQDDRVAVVAELDPEVGAPADETLAVRYAMWGDLTYGAIIGTVEVADVHLAEPGCDPKVCKPWGEQRPSMDIPAWVFHLVLKNPMPVESIPCRGALGLWTLPDDIAARVA